MTSLGDVKGFNLKNLQELKKLHTRKLHHIFSRGGDKGLKLEAPLS